MTFLTFALLQFMMYGDSQIVAIGDSAFNRLVKKEGEGYFSSRGLVYDVTRYYWNAVPDSIPCCTRWARYPSPQRHFGYMWLSTCNPLNCGHKHHKHETWFGK